MAANFHEHYEADLPPMPTPRSTGLVFAAVALIVAGLWRGDAGVALPALGAAAAFTLLALLAPALLGPLNVAWFRFALLLNRFMSPVIMAVLYCIIIVPAGLVMQRCYDPLLRRRSGAADTYWIERRQGSEPTDMRNQF